ncbi:MAG TPA: class I SAM-dependent methyltransferase [Kofleriaceae bacterium]|nr:class I SAM-dependent methyltransferase [Kofleriaceae bacterium]
MSIVEIVGALRAGERSFRVLDPDLGRGLHAGETVEREGVTYVHRPWRVWIDLAERLGMRMLTPRRIDETLVEVRFEPLARTAAERVPDVTEKYGARSAFARISKHEDPGFVIDLAEALARVPLPTSPRVLDLGVNTGDELALVLALRPELRGAVDLVGVDHSASALQVARARFTGERARFIEADLARLATLDLGRFDLVISIGTLQSGALDDRALLRDLVQHNLAESGSVILGMPNCRYIDGEIEYGARVVNLREPEMGLLVKDVAFYRKYLQQHHRRVYVTGKHYLLVTATPA